MIFEHHRFEIWGPSQHPYKHDVSEFSYIHSALPGVTNVETALNYVLAVLYPQTQPAVANVAALPAAGNVINDYRVVQDNGVDGKAASYRWEQREGEASPSWHKIYDMDWGTDSILTQFYLKTQDIYASKFGYDDRDASGVLVAGVLAGQTIFGGATANKNLTLKANSGDGTGSQTGFVQVGDSFRPIADNTLDLGTSSLKFRNLYVGTTISVGTSYVAGTLTLAAGSITDSSTAISFGSTSLSTTGTLACGTLTIGNLVLASASITNTSGTISFSTTNLSTSGTLASGAHTIGNLVLASGSITNTSGTISFSTTNLSTSGTLSAGDSVFTKVSADNITLDLNTISITNSGGNLNIGANGAGVVNITSAMTTIDQTITGNFVASGTAKAGNLKITGNIFSSQDTNGNITLTPNGTGQVEVSSLVFPTTTSTQDLGKTSHLFGYAWLAGGVKDGTNTLAIATLMSLRDILVGASSGMTIFYDGAKWNPSIPDTEITHGTLSGLSADDHLQYALLLGRSGGQTLIGSTLASENLNLDSTSHATKGSIFLKSKASPFTTAAYSAGWTGTDLGDATHCFNDMYSKGVFKGFRLENYTSSTLPTSSAQNVGRLVFSTDNNKIYVDSGTAFIVAGVGKYISDIVFDGSTVLKDVNVSANITDARNCIIQLLDNTNSFERIFCKIEATSASNVRIECSPALPAASYRLIVLE
jgi:hypothetical protein